MAKRWFKKMKKETMKKETVRKEKMGKESWTWAWPWRFGISVWKWKRLDFQLSILDDILFKIVSVFEAIILVSALCFFYLCCGCHI